MARKTYVAELRFTETRDLKYQVSVIEELETWLHQRGIGYSLQEVANGSTIVVQPPDAQISKRKRRICFEQKSGA